MLAHSMVLAMGLLVCLIGFVLVFSGNWSQYSPMVVGRPQVR
jgi:uncharacterized membrane protein